MSRTVNYKHRHKRGTHRIEESTMTSWKLGDKVRFSDFFLQNAIWKPAGAETYRGTIVAEHPSSRFLVVRWTQVGDGTALPTDAEAYSPSCLVHSLE